MEFRESVSAYLWPGTKQSEPSIVESGTDIVEETYSETIVVEDEESESLRLEPKHPKEVEPAAVQEDAYGWTHPAHQGFVFMSLFLQVASFCLLLAAEFIVNWYIVVNDVEKTGTKRYAMTKVNKYETVVVCGKIPIWDMVPLANCSNYYYADDWHPTRCTFAAFVSANSTFQDYTSDALSFVIQLYIWLAIGLSTVALILHLLVFWPLWMITSKVYSVVLNILVAIITIDAFVKFAAGWQLGYFSSIVGETARQRQCLSDLEFNFFLLGTIFFSGLLDVLVVLSLLIALDKGNSVESHLERIAREKADRKNHKIEMEEVQSSLGRRESTYVPDCSKEHEDHMRRISSVIHSDLKTGKA